MIITANDNMAIGTYRAAQEIGLAIPGDIAIISFNDIPVAQFLTPPLTTVKIHGEHIGETAVDLLLERLSAAATMASRCVSQRNSSGAGSCRKPLES